MDFAIASSADLLALYTPCCGHGVLLGGYKVTLGSKYDGLIPIKYGFVDLTQMKSQ
jgi:hypothetical protein